MDLKCVGLSYLFVSFFSHFFCFFGFIIDKNVRLRYNYFNISFAHVRIKRKERKA